MVSRRTWPSLLALVFGMFGLGCNAYAFDISGAKGERGCSNADLRGDFGYTARGLTLPGVPLPPQLLGAFASAGTSSFDGRGRFTLNGISSFNGTIQPSAVSGTYEVNPDCTYTSKTDDGITFFAVITDSGEELFILQTSPATVIAGIATKQTSALPRGADFASIGRPGRCTDKTVLGTYGFIAEGTAGPPTIPAPQAFPLAGVGTVRFNEDGSFMLTAVRSAGGVLDPAPLALPGRYTMNEDCTFSMTFDVGFHFNAAITRGGKEIVFVETDPGTAFIVKAKRL